MGRTWFGFSKAMSDSGELMGDEGAASVPLLPAGAVCGIQLRIKPRKFKCQDLGECGQAEQLS